MKEREAKEMIDGLKQLPDFIIILTSLTHILYLVIFCLFQPSTSNHFDGEDQTLCLGS